MQRSRGSPHWAQMTDSLRLRAPSFCRMRACARCHPIHSNLAQAARLNKRKVLPSSAKPPVRCSDASRAGLWTSTPTHSFLSLLPCATVYMCAV